MPMTEEQKAVAFATLLPGAVGVVSSAAFFTDPTLIDWWKNLKRPSWAVQDNDMTIHSIADLVALVPLAYATAQVWKKGGGLDNLDTRRALATYAINAGLGLVHIPIIKNKCLKGAFVGLGAMFANSVAMHYLYHKVDKQAGYLVLPYTLLCAYYTLLLYNVRGLNKTEETKK